MRLFKETASLLLVALIGATAGWWSVQLFGAAATCELLKYGGAVASLFFLIMRRLNAAFDQGTALSDFDAVTREQFSNALQSYRRRFWARMLAGLLFALYASAIGVLVGKSTTVDPRLGYVLTLTAAAALLVSATMAGTQLWVSSWPSEYIAAIRRVAGQQQLRKAALASYTETKEEPL